MLKKAFERPGRSAAKAMSVAKAPVGIDEATLLRDLRTLVQSARHRTATVAYSTQTLLCWQLGRRLSNEHLQGGRAAYGRQIPVTVSRELTAGLWPRVQLCRGRPPRWSFRVLNMTCDGRPHAVRVPHVQPALHQEAA